MDRVAFAWLCYDAFLAWRLLTVGEELALDSKISGLRNGALVVFEAIARSKEYGDGQEARPLRDVLRSVAVEDRFGPSMLSLVDRMELHERKFEFVERWGPHPEVLFVESKITKDLEQEELRRVDALRRGLNSFKRLSRELSRAIDHGEVGLAVLFSMELSEIIAKNQELLMEPELHAGRTALAGASLGGRQKTGSSRERDELIVELAEKRLLERPASKRSELVRYIQRPGRLTKKYSVSTIARVLRAANLPPKRA